MGFIIGHPWTFMGYDSIWVIVDRLTKSAHLIPVPSTFSVERLLRYLYFRDSLVA